MSAWVMQSDVHTGLYGGVCMVIGFALGLYASWRWGWRASGQSEGGK